MSAELNALKTGLDVDVHTGPDGSLILATAMPESDQFLLFVSPEFENESELIRYCKTHLDDVMKNLYPYLD